METPCGADRRHDAVFSDADVKNQERGSRRYSISFARRASRSLAARDNESLGNKFGRILRANDARAIYISREYIHRNWNCEFKKLFYLKKGITGKQFGLTLAKKDLQVGCHGDSVCNLIFHRVDIQDDFQDDPR